MNDLILPSDQTKNHSAKTGQINANPGTGTSVSTDHTSLATQADTNLELLTHAALEDDLSPTEQKRFNAIKRSLEHLRELSKNWTSKVVDQFIDATKAGSLNKDAATDQTQLKQFAEILQGAGLDEETVSKLLKEVSSIEQSADRSVSQKIKDLLSEKIEKSQTFPSFIKSIPLNAAWMGEDVRAAGLKLFESIDKVSEQIVELAAEYRARKNETHYIAPLLINNREQAPIAFIRNGFTRDSIITVSNTEKAEVVKVTLDLSSSREQLIKQLQAELLEIEILIDLIQIKQEPFGKSFASSNLLGLLERDAASKRNRLKDHQSFRIMAA